MKKLAIISVALLSLMLVFMTACAGLGGGEEAKVQTVQAARGDISLTVNGSGNMEAAEEARLAFTSGGTVESILVSEGDTVTKGQVVASLDTSTLELARDQAAIALAQARVAMTQAQIALDTAKLDLDNTEDSQETLELAHLNAEIALKQAEVALKDARDAYQWPEIEQAQRDLDTTKTYLVFAEEQLAEANSTAEIDRWEAAVENAMRTLQVRQKALDDQLAGFGREEVNIKILQVDSARQAVDEAQKNLNKLKGQIALKQHSVAYAAESLTLATQSVQLARQSLEEAKKNLDKATLVASFDGIVAEVGAKEGDIIPSASFTTLTIVHIINPNLMKLVVDVDEIDIPDIRPGQKTTILVDALPNLDVLGTVAYVYPVPANIGGVVLYRVELGFTIPQDSGLKVGMSAEADISVINRTGILLVPSRAIFRNGDGDTAVIVMAGEEIVEKTVTTGISDGQDTEIVSGLAQGEAVVINR